VGQRRSALRVVVRQQAAGHFCSERLGRSHAQHDLRSSGNYIHDLETRCDKSGEVQTIALLREDRDALQQRVEELEARIALQEREYLEAPIETD
jgi:hypothetical protein